MKIVPKIVFALVLFSGQAVPQHEANPRGGFEPRPMLPRMVYHETVNTPSVIPGRSRLSVFFRIDLSFLIGVRGRNSSQEGFVRSGEIQIEFLDSTGHVIARDIKRFRSVTPENELRPATTWHQGLMDFDLVPGRYTIALAVEDLESERRITEKNQSVKAADFLPGVVTLARPFLVELPDHEGERITPQNFGGGFRFGQPGAFVLVIAGRASEERVRIEYSITGIGESSLPAISDTLQGVIPRNGVILSAADSGSAPGFRVREGNDSGYSVIIVNCEAAKLSPGSYVITSIVKRGEVRETARRDFEVVWPEMPRSLHDLRYAFESLRFITSRDELDSLQAGSEAEARRRFEGFWASKDRTTGTAYNEVMIEYYTRIDEAAERFGTLRSPDGSRTDRGRIYVLYGTPSRTDRKLDPSGFVEIWSYDGLARRFIFLDESKTGNYVLTATQSL